MWPQNLFKDSSQIKHVLRTFSFFIFSNLPYPLHNSAHITAVKNTKYHKIILDIKQFYQEQHQNWHVIDGFHSRWWIWNEATKVTQMMNKYIQTYLGRIKEGKNKGN